jgi:putative FmdB family regulatory protein
VPIFEYACRGCGHQFEALVRSTSAAPACPECKSSDLERLLSLPVVKSDNTRAQVMKSAKQRDKRQAAEINHAQRLYEASHDD